MSIMNLSPQRLLLLIDGNALVHRGFHALPPLTTSRTGEMVNAVYGFANTLFKVVSTQKPSHWAIAFDFPAPTFRHALYDQYKSQRPPTPEELKSQIRRVHELADALGIPSFELEGYEADDILATLALQAREVDIPASILTGDRDLLQVVRPGITVLLPGRNFSEAVTYDEAAVEARFGVTPEQYAAFKALVGDTSDNIPGVPGIGDKTAAKLLSQFGSLEELFRNVSAVTPQRAQSALAASRDQVKASEQLSSVVTDVPLQLTLEDCTIGNYDHDRILSLLKELEFNSLINRLPPILQNDPPPSASDTAPSSEISVTVLTAHHLGPLLQDLEQAQEVVLCVALDGNGGKETRGARQSGPSGARLRGLGLSTFRHRTVYVPAGPSTAADSGEPLPQGTFESVISLLERSDCLKVCDDVKSVLRHLLMHGIPVIGPWFDVPVAAHLVGEKSITLGALASNRLGSALTASPDMQDSVTASTDAEVARWLSLRAAACWSLREQLEAEMVYREVIDLFRNVEMPLVHVLAEMEHNGIMIDTEKLRAMSRMLGEQLAVLEVDIYNAVGHRFNINSPRQLGNVLFSELGLQGGRKISSGYSTEASLLESMRSAHPVIDLVLAYRQLSKLKSTYVDTLPGMVNPRTGRLHTVFSQTGTTTGRLSSSEPNLQNLPIRTELGRTIRAAVVAPKGWALLSADYSQIDLRALAHLSQDEALKAAFLNDEDIHTATAGRVFGVTPDEVTSEMRRAAKVVNFGVIYGMSDYGLEQATGFSRAEAGSFINAYFKQYPGVHRWLEQTKAQAHQHLFVTTLLGRRRYIPEIRSTNRQVRESAERMAINAPVQGTSADIIKIAMIQIHETLRGKGMMSRMLLQIHDELVFEAPEAEVSELSEIVSLSMRTAVELTVPLKVDLKSGPNWADMKPMAD